MFMADEGIDGAAWRQRWFVMRCGSADAERGHTPWNTFKILGPYSVRVCSWLYIWNWDLFCDFHFFFPVFARLHQLKFTFCVYFRQVGILKRRRRSLFDVIDAKDLNRPLNKFQIELRSFEHTTKKWRAFCLAFVEVFGTSFC